MQRLQRFFVLVGMFGTALAIGPCAPTYADLTKMFQGIGKDVIQAGSDGLFDIPTLRNGQLTTDTETVYDLYIRQPVTTLLQNAWANYIDYQMPQDPADALRSGALVRK